MLLNCGVGEDSWESLGLQEIQPVHPKGDPSWVFIERIDVEAETPIVWPPDVKSWLICKDPDAGKDWGQEEKGMTEDKMVGWHHWLDGHGFGWTWVWVDSGSWWWTGRPGMLRFMGSQRVRHSKATELNWYDVKGFPGGSALKNPSANVGDARDLGAIPGSGRSSGGGNGKLFQYSWWKVPWTEKPGGL